MCHRRLQFRDAFSGATHVAQGSAFSRLGCIEAGEGVARHGFVTRCLRAQLTQGYRFVLQLIAQARDLGFQRLSLFGAHRERTRRGAAFAFDDGRDGRALPQLVREIADLDGDRWRRRCERPDE